MRLRSLVVIVCLLCGTAAGAMAAEPPLAPAAQGHLDRGLAHYAAHEYPEAVAEFQAGYAVEPRREFLFAWAQAARLGGDCAAAVPLYQRFLETQPALRQAAAARTGIARCEAEAVATRDPPRGTLEREAKAGVPASVESELVDPNAPAVVTAPPPVRIERPWYLDPLGAGLLGGGVVALGAGATLYALSVASADAAASAATYARYDEEIARAEARRSYAVVALVTGACLMGAGAIRYAWFAPRRPRPALALWLDQGGGGLVVGGAF